MQVHTVSFCAAPQPAIRSDAALCSPGQAQRTRADSSISLALATTGGELDASVSPTATLTQRNLSNGE
jgi:hypothetical protein